MEKKELDLRHTFATLLGRMGDGKKMVLATAGCGRVSARAMSMIVYEGSFYFQTDLHFTKAAQIRENPQIGLCWDNVQIEGHCTEVGHPLAEENRFFAERYKALYPGSYKNYSGLPQNRVYRIDLTWCCQWCYEKGKPYRLFMDLEKREAWREEYAVCEEDKA